jgi:hypothetical protein
MTASIANAVLVLSPISILQVVDNLGTVILRSNGDRA